VQHVSADSRTFAQVIGHIAEWERLALTAFGEIIAGMQWPRMMSLSGYVESDRQVRAFTSVDTLDAAVAHARDLSAVEHSDLTNSRAMSRKGNLHK
jgi:hypothetical protein